MQRYYIHKASCPFLSESVWKLPEIYLSLLLAIGRWIISHRWTWLPQEGGVSWKDRHPYVPIPHQTVPSIVSKFWKWCQRMLPTQTCTLLSFLYTLFIYVTHVRSSFWCISCFLNSCAKIIQTSGMKKSVHKRLLHVHNCSQHIQFWDENEQENEYARPIKSHVVRLCTFMSYNYTISCCTFIAPIVVQHDNLIKTPLWKGIKPTENGR